MISQLHTNYTDEELLRFLYSVEGKDIWFQVLLDWMYYLRVVSISPDEQSVTVEYYDCDNPDQALLEGYDTMEVDIADLDIQFPLDVVTTEELEDVKTYYEREYAEYRAENDDGYYDFEYGDYDDEE